MSDPISQILHLRSLRRDLLLSRIKHTITRVDDARRASDLAEAETDRISNFSAHRAHELRKATQKELHELAARKALESEGLASRLWSEQQALLHEQSRLRQTEAKLDAIGQLATATLASADDSDDD